MTKSYFAISYITYNTRLIQCKWLCVYYYGILPQMNIAQWLSKSNNNKNVRNYTDVS